MGINSKTTHLVNSEQNYQISDLQHLDTAIDLRYLSSILDNLPGMAFVCRNDPATTIEYVSMGSMRILGYTPQALLGKEGFTRMVHPDDRANNKRLMNALSPDDAVYTTTYRIRKANGQELWIKEQGHGIFDDQGPPLVVVGHITDIQEQKLEESRMLEENQRLKAVMKERGSMVDLVGRSTVMQKVYDLILKATDSERPVSITGESGTGKELAARAIHELSSDQQAPFVTVNCGAIPENLFEREFFGHKKGSFSGAYQDEAGYLEQADGGSLFLDELGELPLHMQAKLLRVLDGNGFTAVGGGETRFTRFRLITATNMNLSEMVLQKKMRQDFFYRINVLPLGMPPLRDRMEDIPILVYHFLDKWFSAEKAQKIPEQIMLNMMEYSWPGNVRELENVLSRYITFGRLEFAELPVALQKQGVAFVPEADLQESGTLATVMDRAEKQVIRNALDRHSWRMGDVAHQLGINIRTLQRKLKKHGLR